MQIKPTKLRGFHKALASWYQAHGRHDLPWRNTDDPYAIWVSEIMLQQTQVATVEAKYYAPFLKQFPTIQALAAAPRERVMKAWEGLGYYRRAGFLHDAAQLLNGTSVPMGASRPRSAPPRSLRSGSPQAATRDISLPNDLESLLALPGIGRNTAHAVLAFGFHQPYAVMEANVKRIVARVFAQKSAPDKQLFEFAALLMGASRPQAPSLRGSPQAATQDSTNAEQVMRKASRRSPLVPKAQAHGEVRKPSRSKAFMPPFDYNQAMMDVGATICTPKAPACGQCPAATICQGKTTPEAYPEKKTKKAVPTKHPHIWVIENKKGELFLLKRDAALLGGMYGFPQEVAAPAKASLLGDVKHAYSHFKLHAQVHLVKGNAPKHLHNQGAFYSRKKVSDLPLSKVDLKVLALLA